MRAVSDNPNLAEVSGINVENIVKATWVVGGFCAAATGVFLALDTQFIESTMGLECYFLCLQRQF